MSKKKKENIKKTCPELFWFFLPFLFGLMSLTAGGHLVHGGRSMKPVALIFLHRCRWTQDWERNKATYMALTNWPDCQNDTFMLLNLNFAQTYRRKDPRGDSKASRWWWWWYWEGLTFLPIGPSDPTSPAGPGKPWSCQAYIKTLDSWGNSKTLKLTRVT